MPRYVALLRAINVGGRTVKMSRLRAVFEQLGFGCVETFIASGNVIFDARGAPAALERRIEAWLERTLEFPVGTFLRTADDLERIVAASPFPDETPGGLYIGFGSRPFSAAAAARTIALETDMDRFGVVGREVYWRGIGGIGRSKVTGAAVEKALGAPVTFRSITTLRKLALKMNGHSAIS